MCEQERHVNACARDAACVQLHRIRADKKGQQLEKAGCREPDEEEEGKNKDGDDNSTNRRRERGGRATEEDRWR